MSKAPAVAPPPWLPPDYDPADISALQALVKGTASPEQQQRALNWIIYKAADTYGFTYRQNDRDHAFADGRKFVGQQLVKLLSLNAAKMVKAGV